MKAFVALGLCSRKVSQQIAVMDVQGTEAGTLAD